MNGNAIPAEAKPLVKDTEGEVVHGDFSYSSVIGMLLYLSGDLKQSIAHVVNCAICYMVCPRHSHELALKRIERYLKATCSREHILNPSSKVKIDCYLNADFPGMCGHEKINDPACVKSRTGYVITVADCPVLWQSKFQSELLCQPWKQK